MKSIIDYTNKRNINGKCFENTIQKKIEQHFDIRTYEFKEKERCYVKYPCLIRQYPYKTHNNSRIGRTDFALCFSKNSAIRIECKYQEVPGSTSNKLSELYSKIQAFQEDDIVVVFGGEVAKKDNNYNLFKNHYKQNGITLPGYVEDIKEYKTFFDDNLEELVKHLETLK